MLRRMDALWGIDFFLDRWIIPGLRNAATPIPGGAAP
jgi:hypothetical protein